MMSENTANLAGLPTGETRLAGVMGWPVKHSLSPRLHGFWLRYYGIDGAYIPLAVRPEDLKDALKALPKLGFKGVNLTVPHKEEAFHLVDEAEPFALKIKAVNTIIVRPDGTLLGRNTDGFGFIENLRQSQPSWQGSQAPVAVIGAGGAARAIIAALLDCGVPKIRLVNRSRDRAQVLAAELKPSRIDIFDWAECRDILSDVSLVVNTTTLGMTGQPPLDLGLDGLPGQAIVYDIVYAPLDTELLKAARARGNPAVDGLGMLLHQARPGFAAWFGKLPDVTDELRAFILGK